LPGALELLLLAPTDWRSAFLVGTCLQRLNRPTEALPFYSWVLAQTTSPAARFRMGECQLALGETNAAQDAFLAVLSNTEEADPVHKLAIAAAKPLLVTATPTPH
jgi:thioredoxin-like negative regulator of GroEL